MEPAPASTAAESDVGKRLAELQRVTDAALAYLSVEDLLSELLARIVEVLSVDTAAFLLLEPDGKVLRARAAIGIEEEVERGVRIPIGRGFAGPIAAERRAIAIYDVDHADILNPILREKGIRSLLGVPLLVEDRVIGVLHVGSLTPRRFSEEERDVLQLAGDRASLAIDRAQLVEERRAAEALQRSLLPGELPRMPGVEIAARYLPAAGAAAGGDWYDVFQLPAGRVGLAIGDVVGHGLPAASLMAQLRTGLRAYALDGHPPAAVIERLNRLLDQISPATMTTLAYVVLDPAEESAVMVSAGHVPPLMVEPGLEPAYLAVDQGMALGVTHSARYSEQPLHIPSGSTLLLMTDGVVEKRGESVDEGLERLRLMAAQPATLEHLCDAIVRGMREQGGPSDDAALLALHLLPLAEDLSTSWPAEPEALAGLRHMLRRWLRHHGAGEDDIFDITVACQEACANAVEHAYAPGTAAFAVDATHDGGAIEITVRDHGRWRPARGENRGRGLPLMEALMDVVDVEHTADGTVVVLRRALRVVEPS